VRSGWFFSACKHPAPVTAGRGAVRASSGGCRRRFFDFLVRDRNDLDVEALEHLGRLRAVGSDQHAPWAGDEQAHRPALVRVGKIGSMPSLRVADPGSRPAARFATASCSERSKRPAPATAVSTAPARPGSSCAGAGSRPDATRSPGSCASTGSRASCAAASAGQRSRTRPQSNAPATSCSATSPRKLRTKKGRPS